MSCANFDLGLMGIFIVIVLDNLLTQYVIVSYLYKFLQMCVLLSLLRTSVLNIDTVQS